ncbi:MAG: hypothetical protein ACOH2F_05895 [Cellulomonas sp.]
MTTLAEPAALLDAWERAVRVRPPARAAVLVHHAGLVPTLDDALDLDLGACAALALRVHRETFGDTADAVLTCPRCGELLEARLPTQAPDGADEPGTREPTRPERVVGAWVVRAPTTRDLLVAGRDPASAAQTLRSRCVRPLSAADRLAGEHSGAERGRDDDSMPAEPTPAELDLLDAAAEELAGIGALVSVLTCPACGQTLEAAFDPGALLWERVAAAVPDVLADVATLARAFGWGEAAVLALPAARRRAYLDLATR